MGWRLYARRTTSGVWLDTDVQMSADITDALNGAAAASGVIPWPLVREQTADRLPFWLERGTTLYAEEDRQLKWVGLCDYSRPTDDGLEVGFAGLESAYDLIWFDGRIRQWSPNPYDVVGALIANAHAQPNGDVGFTVIRDGAPARTAGDDEPPVPRPKKPPRRRGESAEAYDDRLFAWEKAVDDWERDYGGREPYSLGWWEQQYVGDELAELAEEIPFTYYARHRWTDRRNLVAAHELVLTTRVGERRADIALVEGVNLTESLTPETDTEAYGNHVVVLGAGEGSGMKRGQSSVADGRIRTTRFGEMKHVKQQQRLDARAATLRGEATTSVVLEAAKVTGRAAAALRLGDEVKVTSRRFEGWCRVSQLTRSTLGGRSVEVTFDRTTSGVVT